MHFSEISELSKYFCANIKAPYWIHSNGCFSPEYSFGFFARETNEMIKQIPRIADRPQVKFAISSIILSPLDYDSYTLP